MHVHGNRVGQQIEQVHRVGPERVLAVPVDVGKHAGKALVADLTGRRLSGPFEFVLNRSGVADLVRRVERAVDGRDIKLTRVGVEAAGHYHRPLISCGLLPSGWQVVELNPAHVATQRKVNGQRGVKTDEVDLTAIFDLLAAGRGSIVDRTVSVLVELAAWNRLRRQRLEVRTATKNRLLGLVDRCFPGAAGCISSSLLATKVGRLIIAEFADPDRLARLGVTRFRRFAANRGVNVQVKVAERFVEAARQALPAAEADVSRDILARDLDLLDTLNADVALAEAQLERLLPATPFSVLTTTPGWATPRVGRYGAAVGNPSRWPGAAQLYRASGLTPKVYESSGKRRDGSISREGSVELRGALLDLGMGLWLCDEPSRQRAQELAARGKPAGIIACAMANRANRIAYAMVRDQTVYDPDRWR